MDGDNVVPKTKKSSVAVTGTAAQKADPEKGIVSNAAELNVAKHGGGLVVLTPNPSSPQWEIDIVVVRARRDEAAPAKEKEPKTKLGQKLADKTGPDGHVHDHVHDANPADADPPPPRLSKELKREAKPEKDWLTTPSMLQSALPTARIMEFPYSAEVMRQKNSATTAKLASQFLQSLEMYRESCPRRPIIYIAHESGGEILRVAFESYFKTYLGPRFNLVGVTSKFPPGPTPMPPIRGRGPPFPPRWLPPPPLPVITPSPPGSPTLGSKLRGFLPRLITSVRTRSLSLPPTLPAPSPPTRGPGDIRPMTSLSIIRGRSRSVSPTSPPRSRRSRSRSRSRSPRIRRSEDSEHRPIRLQVPPMFQTDSLRIVIGVVFLEYNTDREARIGFLRKLAETGIPVQWYLNKKYSTRGRLPMFSADFLRIHEMEFAEPGSLRAFANPEDEENLARVRTEIQLMYKNDSLLDAAYRNDIEKIEALVAERLHPDRPRANGNSPIHIATRLGHVDAVSCFLKHGADITGKTSTGDTPLRIAAEMAYPAVVKLLLEKGAPTDIFDNNGFDFIRWSQRRRHLIAEASAGGLTEEEKWNLLKVCDYLENPPLAEGPSLDGHSRKYYPQNEPPLPPTNFGTGACRTHGIIVADFFIDTSSPEPGPSDQQSTTAPKTYKKEYRIIKSHSVQKTLYTDILQTSSENTLQHVSNKKHSFTWYHIPANNTAWVEGLFVRLGIQDWLEIDTQEHRGRTPHSRVMMAGTNKLDNNKNEGNISFFAPFLSVELSSNQKRMAKWVRAATQARLWGGMPILNHDQRTPPEKYLINAYLDEYRGLHIRRTLDQSHYSMLPNTTDRDKDQVLHRHRDDGPPAVVMVDQLWLWIIDDVLITSFPLKMDRNATGKDALDDILQYVRGNDRKPILTAHDLASVIIEKCTGGLSSGADLASSPYKILDVFGSAIGKVSNEETGLMKKFHANVLKLTKVRAVTAKKKRYRNRHNVFDNTTDYSSSESGLPDYSSYESSDSVNSSRLGSIRYPTSSSASFRNRLSRHRRRARKDPQKTSTRLLNSFNNIAQETTQLIEIKDVKDELGMLMEVLSAQQAAIETFSALTEKFVKKDVLPRTVAVGREQLQRLKQMSEQSEDIFKALNHLLDLKQKQANASEARTANVQAEQADKQGKTLMVFTTVTIIFLPLSFMAAFFAMPVINFPKKPDGSSAMTLGFVSKFIFPISIAISVPFLILAFSVNSIEKRLSAFSRRARAAALISSRWNRRVIEDATGWQRRKMLLAWFAIGVWRWMRAAARGFYKSWRRFWRAFRWRRVEKRVRTRARQGRRRARRARRRIRRRIAESESESLSETTDSLVSD